MSNGVKVVYVTGNHDEMLRRYSGFKLGNFLLDDKLLLDLNDQRIWFFHGDVFDMSMQHGKWIAKLGGVGYDLLIRMNRFVNKILESLGYEKYSFSKKVKGSVKAALKHVNNFENTVAAIAIDNGYDYVVCGHIHEPVIKEIKNNKGKVIYLNSGDWVENLSSLEFINNQWSVKFFKQGESESQAEFEETFPEAEFVFGELTKNFKLGG